MLTIVAFVLPMLVIPTSYADRFRKKIALKQERIKRSAQDNSAARKQLKRVDLTPARGRTKAEQERLAAKKKAEEEGRESHAAEMWPREMPPPGVLSQLNEQMSPMGALAAGARPKISRKEDWHGKVDVSKLRAVNRRALESLPKSVLSPSVIGSADLIVHDPNEFTVFSINGPSDLGFQSETSIDSNDDGTVLVAGFNDLSGFLLADDNGNQSISGVARSTDGGATWAEVTTDADLPGLLPVGGSDGQVFGDPDVKWSPRLNAGAGGFYYASIFVRNSDGIQGMCVNISDPDGDNWSDPIEVDPTFRPNTPFDDAADKEFIDVNLETGRIIMSWTNFPGAKPELRKYMDSPASMATAAAAQVATPVQILTTYSDDEGATWSTAVVVGQSTSDPQDFVQSSMPRFIPGTSNADAQVYVAYRVAFANGTRNVAVNRSTDGGTTWLGVEGVPIDVPYPEEDQIPGVDRVNNSPALDVDYDTERVYVAYQRNNPWQNQPFGTTMPPFTVGDIAMRTFIGAPTAPSVMDGPFLINSDPGKDYAQQYATVAVDQSTGRVWVNFLDQHVTEQGLPSGDLFESVSTFSTDNGATWSPPTAVSDRPWHAGYGNDSSEPNMGDYNQNVAEGGRAHTLWGGTSVQPLFTECKNPFAGLMCSPDTYYDKRLESQQIVQLRVLPGSESFVEVGNNCSPNTFFDPRERANFTVPLKNYVTNPNTGATTITGITAVLTSTTPGVTIVDGTAAYPDIAPGDTENNSDPFTVELSSSFVAGTIIDFVLSVTTAQGTTQQMFRTETGTPGTPTTLLSENFDGATMPNLPAGWTQAEGGCELAPGACIAAHPWVTSTARTTSQAAFHPNSGTNSEWIRLFSPTVAIPTPASGVKSYVTVDFDLNYSLEDNPAKLFEAFDGMFLRILDGSAPTRSIIAESFATKITTAGKIDHYPAHLVRSNDPAYFADMSVWSDDSIELDNDTDGTIHVSMKFNAETMTGKNVQLRFEYTEDSNLNCLGSGGNAPCGIAIDNVVFKHVEFTNGGPSGVADLSITKTDSPDPVVAGDFITYHLVAENHGPDDAPNVVVTDKLPQNVGFASATPSQGTCYYAAGVVTCNMGTINNGAQAIVDIVVRTRAPNTITDTALIASAVCDVDSSNNIDREKTKILGLRSLSLSPSSVTGGCGSSTGTVLLTGPAGPGGVVVKLRSNNRNVHVPPTVTVNEGETSAQFTATTDVVSTEQLATITATAGVSSVIGRLKVLPIMIASLSLSPNPVHGGGNSVATVTLTCAPDEDVVVRLTSSRPTIAMPVSPITIHAGQMSGQATIHTTHVNSQINVDITAYANADRARATLKVIP
jgi:uncharacterized repeat protein (TIGR01451 family)